MGHRSNAGDRSDGRNGGHGSDRQQERRWATRAMEATGKRSGGGNGHNGPQE